MSIPNAKVIFDEHGNHAIVPDDTPDVVLYDLPEGFNHSMYLKAPAEGETVAVVMTAEEVGAHLQSEGLRHAINQTLGSLQDHFQEVSDLVTGNKSVLTLVLYTNKADRAHRVLANTHTSHDTEVLQAEIDRDGLEAAPGVPLTPEQLAGVHVEKNKLLVLAMDSVEALRATAEDQIKSVTTPAELQATVEGLLAQEAALKAQLGALLAS